MHNRAVHKQAAGMKMSRVSRSNAAALAPSTSEADARGKHDYAVLARETIT